MKRSSRINPKDPPKISSSSVRGITGIQGSDNRFVRGITGIQGTDNRFSFTTTLENEDMNRVKRVKFRDPETDHLPNCRPDASSVLYEATQAPRSDAPKTSEYAFFKKLKKDACSHSYLLHKEDNQLKDVDLSECTREIPNMFKQHYMDFRSSLPVEKARSVNHDSFLSPPGNALKNSDITNMVDPCCKGTRSPLLIEKVMPINHDLSSPFSDGSKNSDKGVFSTKRRKLRQWIADTSLPEADEFCSKGFDLVSVLLSRLFPEGNENNCCMDPKSRQVEIDTKYQLPSFSDSDTHVKGLHWTCTRNSMESGHGSYWDDDFFRYWPDRPRDVVLSELDTVGSEFPSTSYHQYKYSKPLCDLEDRRIPSLRAESDSFFRLSFEKYGSISSGHLKELDDFHYPTVPALKGEPHTLLLGWDFTNEKDEQDLPIMPHNTERNLFSALATSWGNDADALCSSSLLSNNSLYFTSLPHSRLVNFHSHDLGGHLEDEKYLVSELDQFPLTISYNSKYLELVEDCITDKIPEGSSIFLSPQDQRWYMKQVFGEMHHPGLESLLPTGLDTDLGWKCLSMTDSFSEHHFSPYHSLQFPECIRSYLLGEEEKESCLYNFERSHDKKMGCRLRLDKF